MPANAARLGVGVAAVAGGGDIPWTSRTGLPTSRTLPSWRLRYAPKGRAPATIVDDTAGRAQVETRTESEVVDQQSTGPGRPEELLRLFDLSHDLMAIIGRDGCFRHVN